MSLEPGVVRTRVNDLSLEKAIELESIDSHSLSEILFARSRQLCVEPPTEEAQSIGDTPISQPMIRENSLVDCLRSICGSLRRFTRENTRESPRIGFGQPEAPEVNCTELANDVRATLQKLDVIDTALPEDSIVSMLHRGIIPEITAMLEMFLFELSSATCEGMVDRNGIPAVMNMCISLTKDLREIAHKLDLRMKLL